MDRMPKEYKIPVYIISMTIAYFCIYLFVLYRKSSLSPSSSVGFAINLYAAVVILFNIIFLVFYLLKRDIGRIGLVVIYILELLLSFVILLSLAFLKTSSVIIANLFRISTFDVYVLVPMLANSARSAAMSLLIFDAWFLVIIVQLLNKDVKQFIKTKTYPLVNTQLATSAFIIGYAISLGVVSVLIKL
jgi:hypothetical protein